MLIGNLFNDLPKKLKLHEFRNLSFDSRYCKNKDIHTTIRVIHGKFASNTKERISHILKEEDQNVIGLRVSNIGCDSCELEIDWESYNNFRTYNGEVY